MAGDYLYTDMGEVTIGTVPSASRITDAIC